VLAVQELALRAVLELFALDQDLHGAANGLLIDFELTGVNVGTARVTLTERERPSINFFSLTLEPMARRRLISRSMLSSSARTVSFISSSTGT
jgi:hypothetical protein